MILIPIISVFLAVVPPIESNEMADILSELDKTIERRDMFISQKERRIQDMKEDLASCDDEAEFGLCRKLFDEYKYYQYDSAYRYARRLESLSLESCSAEQKVVAYSALIFCFKSVGFFNEAVALINDFQDIEIPAGGGIPSEELVQFYLLCAETYQNMSSYVSGSADLSEKYDVEKNRYYDLVLRCSTKDSYEYAWITLERNLISGYTDDLAINGRRSLIARFNMSEHDYAVQYSILASAFNSLGRTEESIYYRAISAIYDIRSCTHETTSAKALAECFYEKGDISRAYRYIRQAMYDARFYNSRLRLIEINTILPKIESRRYDWINNQRVLSLVFAGIVFALLAVISVFYVKLRKRNRQLSEIHEKVLNNTATIKAQNLSLSELNRQLKEANEIKDEYIIQSLYGNPQFVNEVEKQSTFAVRKILTRQYDDAVALLRNMGIKKERERMYESFDEAFLKLFPNFISEFNWLFPEEYRISVEGPELPMEVRIFALLRLGIDNTSQVAEYLNLSVNTVYVYKTKVKSKSSVPKDEFENRINAIPKP